MIIRDRVMLGELFDQVIHQPPCFMYEFQELSTKPFHSLLFALLQDTILQTWRRAEWTTTCRIVSYGMARIRLYCIVTYPYFGIWCNILSLYILFYVIQSCVILCYPILSCSFLFCTVYTYKNCKPLFNLLSSLLMSRSLYYWPSMH